MANPFVLGASLHRLVEIRCPYCRHAKLVENRPAHHRVCAKCHRHFPDPLAARARKRR